jgi:hypothetical protein
LKDTALGAAVEPVECPTIFFDDQLGEQADAGAARGKPDGDPDRDGDFVAHSAIRLHHERLTMTLGYDS